VIVKVLGVFVIKPHIIFRS